MKRIAVGLALIAILSGCGLKLRSEAVAERKERARLAAEAEHDRLQRLEARRPETMQLIADAEKNIIGPLSEEDRLQQVEELLEANLNSIIQRAIDECVLEGHEPLSDMILRCFRVRYREHADAYDSRMRDDELARMALRQEGRIARAADRANDLERTRQIQETFRAAEAQRVSRYERKKTLLYLLGR